MLMALDPIGTLSDCERPTKHNPPAQKLYGLSQEDAITKPPGIGVPPACNM
jgi:hypothetical protein